MVVGQKRGSIEVGEKSEAGHKRVKMRDLESIFRSEGISLYKVVQFYFLCCCLLF